MIRRLVEWLVSHWQARCGRDEKTVWADLLSRDAPDMGVQWCLSCGACRRTFGDHCTGEEIRMGDWHRPNASLGGQLRRERAAWIYPGETTALPKA